MSLAKMDTLPLAGRSLSPSGRGTGGLRVRPTEAKGEPLLLYILFTTLELIYLY
jgi:hypothetical protein